MSNNVKSIFPANDFRVVAEAAVKDIDVGIIIGYTKDGDLSVFGGGMIGGRQPACKDWLWMIEAFKQKMISGDYYV